MWSSLEHHSQQCVERLPTAHGPSATIGHQQGPSSSTNIEVSAEPMDVEHIVLFPVQDVIFNLNHHDANMRVDVYPTGKVKYIAGATAYSWVSLNGIIFEAV